MEALRDRLLHGVGTEEPWFLDEEFLHDFAGKAVAAHWRKPLRIDEIAQMADTPEVRQRPGRP
jgi:hypothetical protein